MSDPTTTTTTTTATTGDDDHEGGALRTALHRLVDAGTITKDQAKAVHEAVREERRKHKKS